MTAWIWVSLVILAQLSSAQELDRDTEGVLLLDPHDTLRDGDSLMVPVPVWRFVNGKKQSQTGLIWF